MDNNKILVSIITPCFNSEKTIQKTLDSVLHQTYGNIEYIIIDGNSTDGTMQIVRQYEPLFEGRMKVVSEPDQGIYDAMNKGIGMATGELIGIVNSDDYYNLDAVKNMVAEMTGEKYIVLYGYQRCITNGLEDKIVIYHHRNLDRQMITHPTCFVSRSVYEDFGLFDTKYRSSADYEFMLRLFHKGQVTFKAVYKVISNFESGGMSSSEVGVRETARLRLEYGIISKMRYYQIILRSRLHDCLKSCGHKFLRKCRDASVDNPRKTKRI